MTRPRLSGSFIPLGVVLLSCLVEVGPVQSQTLRIGVFDRSRHGVVSLPHTEFAVQLRASLSRNIAALGFDAFEFVEFGEITDGEALVEAIDLMILHPASDFNVPMTPALSLDEQDALGEYVRSGGGVLLATGTGGCHGIIDSASNRLLAPFGLRITCVETRGPIVVHFDHPVTDGPFGRAGRSFDTGSWFDELGDHATSLAEIAGQPLVAVIERDAFGPGSGRAVLWSDSIGFADGHVATVGFFPQSETLFLNSVAWLTEAPSVSGPSFVRGDANGDGRVDLSDAVSTLGWLFLGASTPGCVAATDTNSDEAVDISDPIWILTHLFLGGPAPAAPFPDCGSGSDADQSRCETPPSHCAS
jgi:hypothetical protein